MQAAGLSGSSGPAVPPEDLELSGQMGVIPPSQFSRQHTFVPVHILPMRELSLLQHYRDGWSAVGRPLASVTSKRRPNSRAFSEAKRTIQNRSRAIRLVPDMLTF